MLVIDLCDLSGWRTDGFIDRLLCWRFCCYLGHCSYLEAWKYVYLVSRANGAMVAFLVQRGHHTCMVTVHQCSHAYMHHIRNTHPFERHTLDYRHCWFPHLLGWWVAWLPGPHQTVLLVAPAPGGFPDPGDAAAAVEWWGNAATSWGKGVKMVVSWWFMYA